MITEWYNNVEVEIATPTSSVVISISSLPQLISELEEISQRQLHAFLARVEQYATNDTLPLWRYLTDEGKTLICSAILRGTTALSNETCKLICDANLDKERV